MASKSRSKMIKSAAALIGSRGMNATSFSDVLADSGAPRGSIYHNFPKGKRQLAEEAMRWTSDVLLGHQRACRGTTAREVLSWFVDLWRQSVVASNACSGCAVAGVALDIQRDDDLMGIAREMFQAWVELLAEQLHSVGVALDQANAIAVTSLAAMEGALILCRVESSVDPLNRVANQLMSLVQDE